MVIEIISEQQRKQTTRKMHNTNNCPNQKSMLLAQKQSLKISCDNNIISKSILLDILHIRISYCLLVLRNLCRLWRLLLWYSFFFARPYLSFFFQFLLFAIRSLSSQSKRHVVTFSALLSDQLILWRTLGAFDRHLAGSRTKSRGERKTPASNLLNCNSNVHAFVETLITTSEAKGMRPILCSRCSFYGRLNKIRAMHCM